MGGGGQVQVGNKPEGAELLKTKDPGAFQTAGQAGREKGFRKSKNRYLQQKGFFLEQF